MMPFALTALLVLTLVWCAPYALSRARDYLAGVAGSGPQCRQKALVRAIVLVSSGLLLGGPKALLGDVTLLLALLVAAPGYDALMTVRRDLHAELLLQLLRVPLDGWFPRLFRTYLVASIGASESKKEDKT